MKILTVIVPTYNMEKYLDKCLASLIVSDQSLMDLLEVLVVNDGSKDRSSEIAHGYESRYPNTFKVIDKQNGNYGSCINAALPVVTGTYVKVLDADDRFETSNFEQYLIELKNSEVDLIITKSVSIIEGSNIEQDYGFQFHIRAKDFVRFEDIIAFGDFAYSIRMHNLTYRTENLKRINYKQTEGISYTDNEWVFLPMITVSSILLFPIVIYKYTIGRLGQTVSKERMRELFRDEKTMSFNLCRLYMYYKDKCEKTKKKYLEEYIICHIKNLYLFEYTNFMYPNKEFKDFDLTLKKNYPDIYDLLRGAILVENISIEKMGKYFQLFYVYYLFRIMRVKIGAYKNALTNFFFN